MDNNLLILGAGMYGCVVKETAMAMGIFDKISFVDDNCTREDVVGTTDMLGELSCKYRYCIVAIGNLTVRRELFSLISELGYEIPTLVHPQAYLSLSAKIGRGTVIEPMAVVHSNANVGNGCLICAGSIVNHNADIGDFCQIDCNAVIGAAASVPARTKIMYGEIVAKN